MSSPETFHAVHELMARYCYHFDRNEPELVVTIFTDNATVDYGPEYPAVTGREAIRESITAGLQQRFNATSHHVSNVLVLEESSAQANAVVYVYAWHSYRDGSPDGELWGQYHLDLRATDNGWKIHYLTLKGVGMRHFHRSTMHSIGRHSPA